MQASSYHPTDYFLLQQTKQKKQAKFRVSFARLHILQNRYRDSRLQSLAVFATLPCLSNQIFLMMSSNTR